MSSLPWLKSRRRMITSSSLDIIIYLLIYHKNYIQFYRDSSFLQVQNLGLILLWLILSYITGRYFSGPSKISARLYDLISTLIVTLFCISFGLFSKIIFKLDAIDYNTFCAFASLSFIIQISINYITKIYFSGKARWYFIGSQEEYIKFKSNLKYYRIIQEVKRDDKIIKIFNEITINLKADNRLENFRLKLILSDETIKQRKKFNLINDNKRINMISILEWCDIYLQRYPPSLISNELLSLIQLTSNKSNVELRVKRIAELFISLLIIIISLPIIIIAAILIKIEDGGPIFYTQLRTGRGGKTFNIYKLRTMKVLAERDGLKWAKKNDARITLVGNFLRKMRIDELPQLVSVITGTMSLIGPRPERPEFDKILGEKIPNYYTRQTMKPGLSGWAQVNYPYGASVLDSENKLSYDLYYIKNFSTLLDILIFFKTVRLVFTAKGSVPKV